VLAHRGVDALDPQGAEIALAVLAVAIGVLQRLLDRLPGDADGVLAAAVETLGLGENLLVPGVAGSASFHAHVMISLNLVSDRLRCRRRWAESSSRPCGHRALPEPSCRARRG